AVQARAIGRGGISQVAEATRLSRATIRAGLQELVHPVSPTAPQATVERVRRWGGGRKPLGAHDPHLVRALETLLDPVTRGDPRSLLRWTCKSAAKLAAALQTQGHAVSERPVNRLLHELGHIPSDLVVACVPAHRRPPDVRIWRLRNQSRVGTVPPSTSTPHCPACWARRW